MFENKDVRNKQINIRLTSKERQLLCKIAFEKELTLSSLIRYIINEYLENNK